MHRRKIVRDAMIETIKNAATAAGQRVIAHRSWSFNEDELPAVRVFVPQEAPIAGQSFTGDRVSRIMIRVEAIVIGNDSVEDDTDALCEQIENAVMTHPTLGGQVDTEGFAPAGACQYCQLQSVEIDFEDDDKTVMVATNEYEAVV